MQEPIALYTVSLSTGVAISVERRWGDKGRLSSAGTDFSEVHRNKQLAQLKYFCKEQ